MAITLNTSIQYADLPKDAPQYIYEALMLHNRESDYSGGQDDDKMTRKYNLLFLLAMKNVFSSRSVPAFRRKFTPSDVVDGYGPLPIDFLDSYQSIYDFKILEVQGVTQLCGRSGCPIEYIAIPNAIGSLPYLCQEAIKKRFLYECKGIDAGFEVKAQLFLADFNEAMALWIAQADQFNNVEYQRRHGVYGDYYNIPNIVD